QAKLTTMVDRVTTTVGGPQSLVEILNRGDRSTERVILQSLASEQPELADEVKQLMFVFEDIQKLDNRTIQLILREVESDDLRLALKGTNESFRDIIFRNMSERAAQGFREDMEMMGPVRVRDVEMAQQKIVAIVRQLEEAGELVIARGVEDNLIE
ncbi:MAG TPA: FliG C-terminal domain-containing protein, partial [Armatimonadota bacterium]